MENPSLDHVSVLTSNLAESIRFYVEVVGLTQGPRPAMDFDGAWLYAGNRAVIHLICTENAINRQETGALDHVAFKAEGLAAYEARLAECGITYATNHLPDAGLTQLFICDPEGITGELNFFGARSGPARG